MESRNAATREWLAMQASYGNGFLDTPEHRQQYKVNALQGWDLGAHRLTAVRIGYYGQSKIPGLVPIDVPNLHDTIDPRQRDQTHTGEIALNDVWHLTPASDLQLSGFFRTYNLSLSSNFGDGLIRQSEFRTVTGGNANYIRKVNRHFSLMAGARLFPRSPAPRRSGSLPVHRPRRLRPVRESDGEQRHPQFRDAVRRHRRQHRCRGCTTTWAGGATRSGSTTPTCSIPANSFNRWVGINSPKATLGHRAARKRLPLPSVSFSFGQTFLHQRPADRHRNDAGQPGQPGPRLSTGGRQNDLRHAISA